jgi:hypothetical protein
MVLYVKHLLLNTLEHYVINNVDDLDPIFERYPFAFDVAFHSSNLKDAVQNIASYLGRGFMDAWVEYPDNHKNEEISKSIKNKSIAIGLAALSSLLPVQSSPHAIIKKPTLTQEHKLKDDFGLHPLDGFLWTIMQLESSGGKYLKHKLNERMKQNPHLYQNETAVGRWGLLPNTIREFINRMKLSNTLNPDYIPLKDMNSDELAEHFIKNPQHELDFARMVAHHVLSNNKNDIKRAAYAWINGHNLKFHQISNTHLNSSPYIKKFIQAHKLNPFVSKTKFILANEKLDKKEKTPFKNKFDEWVKKRLKENDNAN